MMYAEQWCISLLVLISRSVVQPAGAREKSSTCRHVNISVGFDDPETMPDPTLFMLNGNGGNDLSHDAHAAVMNVQEFIYQFGNLTMTTTNTRMAMTVEDYVSAPRLDKESREEFQQLFAGSDGRALMLDAVFAQVAGRLQPFLANLNHRLVTSVGHEGSGSRMHKHNASWLYLATGIKQWLMLPPSVLNVQHLVEVNPCTLLSTFPREDWMTCIQHTGEILYLPAGTWHATCNFGSSEDGHASDSGKNNSGKNNVVIGAGAQGFTQASNALLYASRDGNAALIHTICAAGQLQPSSQVAPLLSKRGRQEAYRKRFSRKEVPETAMHIAASHDRVAVVKCLMSANCGGSWMLYAPAGIPGNQPVHEAAKWGSLHVLNLLLIIDPALINATSLILRSTPLHLAARAGHIAVAEILLLSRADIDAQESAGRTALHEAVEHSQMSVLELLVAHGADSMIPDAREDSPMHTALGKGHQAVLALLSLGSQRGMSQLLVLAESPKGKRKEWQALILNGSSPLGSSPRRALAAEATGSTGVPQGFATAITHEL
jgi:ankyrin repeat protein